jgi:biopolymer transport protein ExbD
MIDMVFLLLVFFMVTAQPTKPERDLKMTLPGAMMQEKPMDLPDEQRVTIQADGQVLLNQQPLDNREASELPQLVNVLRRFKEAADRSRSKALVSLDPSDEVPHQRVVDVLGACAKAGIQGVTFTQSGVSP